LPRRTAVAKARTEAFPEARMSGIYMILAFLAVMAALNFFEFGRLD
jgi:hypothetical protein